MDASKAFSGFKSWKEYEANALGLVFCGHLISDVVEDV